jgi:hypothetical protein
MTISQTALNSSEHRPHISRRELLKGSAVAVVAVGAAAVPSVYAAIEQPVPDTSNDRLYKGKVIDCHAHLTHRSRAT